MKIAQLRKHDVANGPGIRTTIFVSGCTHNCEDCFNKEYQNFGYGDLLTGDLQDKILSYYLDDNVQGLSILGGEPLQQGKELLNFIKKFKFIVPEKNIWLWTGYTFEEIMDIQNHKHIYNRELLRYIDVLVDGKFEKDLKDVRLKFRGSSNQRIIDVNKTLEESKVVLYDI